MKFLQASNSTLAFSLLLLLPASPGSSNAAPVATDWARPPLLFYTDVSRTTPGLVGSYVDEDLSSYLPHDDWRQTQILAGQRLDPEIDFETADWGLRDEVNLTQGTDENWDYFSVQWDGYVEVLFANTRLATRSDDSSRMWIDIDRNGQFGTASPEFVDNNWGSGQPATLGPWSVVLEPGLYPIRVQYNERILGNVMQLVASPPPALRFIYLIPSNRAEQPGAEENQQDYYGMVHDFFGKQMERYGFGNRSFNYETERDGVTPKIHVVHVPQTDVELFGLTDPNDPTSGVHVNEVRVRVRNAANDAGYAVGSAWTAPPDRQAWVIIPEIHIQYETPWWGGAPWWGGDRFFQILDGPFNNAWFVPIVHSQLLSLLTTESLLDVRAYDGLQFDAIGPYPLVQDQSFAWNHGTTISGVVSVWMGGTVHEIGHTFGLLHDPRNYRTRHGNAMWVFHGFRGYVHPSDFPDEDCSINYGHALVLSTSRFFAKREKAAPYRDTTPPTISATGDEVLDGLMRIEFTASDDSRLAVAQLIDQDIGAGGTVLWEMPIDGTSVTGVFETPYWEPDEQNVYRLEVFDAAGNVNASLHYVTPPAGPNRAPRPHFTVQRVVSRTGEIVTFDAEVTQDPEFGFGVCPSCLYEWDLDGDGVFEVPPSASRITTRVYQDGGTYDTRLRVADPSGDRAIATHIPVTIIDELLVDLESFTAEPVRGGVVVRWSTAAEKDNAGFRVLRRQGNRSAKLEVLTPQPLPARGSEVSGAEYEYFDRLKPQARVVQYFLEDVDVFGNTTRHGPVTVRIDPFPREEARDAKRTHHGR